jgi:hypothetical protein
MEDELGGVKRQFGRRLAGDQKHGSPATAVMPETGTASRSRPAIGHAANRRRMAVDGSVKTSTWHSAACHIAFDAVTNWFSIGAAGLLSSASPASG